MRALGTVGVMLLGITVGCGERALRDDDGAGDDGGAGAGGAIALSVYCSGSSRMALNGQDTPVTVTGRAAMPAYANEQATIVFTPVDSSGTRVLVTWHATNPQGVALPAKLDLADLPDGWSVTVYAGCSPSEAGCGAPKDVLASGLTGSLEVSGEFPDYQVTVCLESQESTLSPRPELHSVQLWASSVPASYDFSM